MNARRLLPLVVGLALVVTLGAHAITASPGAAAAALAPSVGDSVTLLTGDRVHLGRSSSGVVRLEPAPGREKVRFVVESVQDHLYVVPADAFRLVGSGRVDRRLFDVAALVAHGFGDANQDYLPLAVRDDASARADKVSKVRLAKRDAARFWTQLARGTTSVRWDVPAVGASPPATAATPQANAGTVGDDVKVTLRLVGRDGKAASDYFVSMQGYDGTEAIYPYDPSGTVTVQVPAGRYLIRSSIYGAEDGSTSLLVQPWADLQRDMEIAVDARRARPVVVTVPQPSAKLMHVAVQSYATTARGISQALEFSSTFENFFVGHLGAPAPQKVFTATVTSHFADASREFFEDSPYRYNVAYAQHGQMFDGFRRHITEDDLATVTIRYSDDGPPDFSQSHAVTSAPVGIAQQIGIAYPIHLRPGINPSRTEYFAGDGVRWMQDWSRGNPTTQEWEGAEVTPWQQFDPGSTHHLRWGSAVIGPGIFHDDVVGAATRSADTMTFSMPMFSPGLVGFTGFSVPAQARTVLSRDGTVIGETTTAGAGSFAVPPEPATYRLDVQATRKQYEFSPTVDATWTFPSGPVPAERVDPLRLMAIRFNPALNDHNQAPPGVAFDLPLWVEWQQALAEPKTAQVSVSYDDGAHWADAVVTRTDAGWVARLIHPNPGIGTGYVSLRATATDGAGSSVTQTIIRAYGLTSLSEPQ